MCMNGNIYHLLRGYVNVMQKERLSYKKKLIRRLVLHSAELNMGPSLTVFQQNMNQNFGIQSPYP